MTNRLFGLVGTSFGLVALYLLLVNSRGTKDLFQAAGGAWVNLIKALQGR